MLGLLLDPLFLSMLYPRWNGGMHEYWCTQKAMHPLQTLTGEALSCESVLYYVSLLLCELITCIAFTACDY